MSLRKTLALLSVVLAIAGVIAIFAMETHQNSTSLIIKDLSFSNSSSTQTPLDIHFKIGTITVMSSSLGVSVYATIPFLFGTVVADRQADRETKLRDRILSEIREQPGIHLRELQRSIGCAMGALQYHLSHLEEAGVIISLRTGNTKHFFPSTFSTDKKVLKLTAMLRNPTIRAIIQVCFEKNTVTQAALSRELSTDKSLISYYITSLLENGFLRSFRVFGREKPIALTPWTRNTIIQMGLATE